MSETRTVHDPFLGKDVEVSDNLLDRLRGRYAMGPALPNGEPEFGWREFPTPPIQKEAAQVIERMSSVLRAIAGDKNVPAYIHTLAESAARIRTDQ